MKLKLKKKNPRGGQRGLKKKDVIVAAVKADGSPKKMADKLGISKPTAFQYLQQEDVKEAVLTARDKALKEAGIELNKVFKVIAAGMEATKVISCNVIAPSGEEMLEAHGTTKDFIDVVDYKERRESAKLCAQLLGEFKDSKESEGSGKVVVNMPVIFLNGQPLKFSIGKNA